GNDRLANALDAFLIVLILANAVAVAVETVPTIAARHDRTLALFESFSVAAFSLEYLARLWACVERSEWRGRPSWRRRLRYMLTPLALIDLLAVLPFYIGLAAVADLRYLRLLRLFRLLKLVRYSTALAALLRVIENEARTLAAALVVMAGLVFVAATLMYYVERGAQPVAFGSIPAAMWWAVVTLTTVGYGDVVPVTGAGRVLATVIMVFGLAAYAIPIGIMAAGFSEEVRRQSFVVRMEMVARVPIFASQTARVLSRLSRLLRAEKVAAGHVVCVAGTASHGLTIIAEGQAVAHMAGRALALSAGDYFGELALLQPVMHDVTVVARTTCRLLVLEAQDFARLIERKPEVAAAMAPAVTAKLTELSEKGEITQEAAQRAIRRWRALAESQHAL
ncbi:MAG: cyclic nucleotide-binding protein, partial [Alphaproteobacteria bacterium]